MKQDENRPVLGSLPSFVGSRGHRSLGDDSNVLAALSGSGKLPGDEKNINSRGWNFSTRASPVWRHRSQGNKENPKVLLPKKFQHVQSKLSAPIYSQRRQAQRKEGTQPLPGSISAGIPPRSSSLRERPPAGNSLPNEQPAAEAAATFDFCQPQLGVAGSPDCTIHNKPPDEANPHQATLEEHTNLQATLEEHTNLQATLEEHTNLQAALEEDTDLQGGLLPWLQAQLGAQSSLEAPIAGDDSCPSPASIASARATAPGTLASSIELSSASIVHPSSGMSAFIEPLNPNEDVVAPATTADLNFISREPEQLPFSAGGPRLSCGLDGPSCRASPAAADSTCSMRVTPSDHEVQLKSVHHPDCSSPQLSPTRSAGLSVVSRPAHPVAFDAWARVQKPCNSPSTAISFESSATAYAQAAPPRMFAGQESVCKPSRYDESPGTVAMLSSPTHGAHLRSNPLFESDSPASSISMALPERSDALHGFSGTPSPARQTAIPSLASTPMTERSQGPPSIGPSPLGKKLYDSPCAPLRCMDGNVTSPCCYQLQYAAVESSPQSESEAPSFGDTATGAYRNSGLAGSDASSGLQELQAVDTATTGLSARVHDTFADAADPDALGLDGVAFGANRSPSSSGSLGAVDSPIFGAYASKLCSDTTEVEGEAEVLAGIITQPVSAASSPTQHSHTSVDAKGSVLDDSCSSKADRDNFAGSHGNSYPATPSATWPESPSTVYATPLDDFPTPCSLVSFANGMNRSAEQQSRTPSASGQFPKSQAATPADFSFGLGQPRIVTFDRCTEAATPDLALGLPGLGTSRLQDAAASVLSPRLRSPLPGPGACGFGSPLPLLQLTPLQLRVLDDFAGKVLAAMSPVRFEAHGSALEPSSAEQQGQQCQAAGDESSKLAHDTTAEHLNFGDLLAQLRSPLPVPLARSTASIATHPDDKGRPQSLAQHVEEPWLPLDEITAPGMPPPASPMPNFAQLIAFLNGHGRTPARVGTAADVPCASQPSPELPQASSGADAEPSATGGLVDQAAMAAAAFSFVQLLAHLRSPLPKGGAVGSKPAHQQVSNNTSLQAATGVDSPVIVTGIHDSPATSEAASFGFSTAAKQMSVRMTPSTTPGDCAVSFLRWTRDTAPPTFRLDSEAGASVSGRETRSPMTPMSFTFGGQMHGGQASEEATPVMGRQQPAAANDSSVSPDGIRRLRDINSPPQSEQFEDIPASAASPAFSFGLRRHVHVVTPAALACARTCHGGTSIEPFVGGAGDSASRSATPVASSPVPSLGFWAFSPSFGPDGAAFGSPTPSEFGFTFNLADTAVLATPMLAGVANAAAAAAATLAADTSHQDGIGNVVAALEHVVAMSPTLFGMAAAGSPEDTPGVMQRVRGSAVAAAETAVPHVPAFWTALLGSLNSPMPSHIQSKAARSQQQALTAHHQSPASGGLHVVDTAHTGGVQNVSVTENSTPQMIGQSPGSPGQAPPSYDALPDLIARGLCLPASIVLATQPARSSSVDENAAPFAHNRHVAGTTLQTSTAVAQLPAADSVTVENESLPLSSDRLFQPSRRPFVSPPSEACFPCHAQPAAGDLVLESVSDSNQSAPDALQSDVAPCRTTEPLPTPTCKAPTALSFMLTAHVDGSSVHNSPVQSFYAPSDSSGVMLPQSLASVHGEQGTDAGMTSQEPVVRSTEEACVRNDDASAPSQSCVGHAARCSPERQRPGVLTLPNNSGDFSVQAGGPFAFDANVSSELSRAPGAEAQLPAIATAQLQNGIAPKHLVDKNVIPASPSEPSPPAGRSVSGEPQSPAYSYMGPWVPTVTPATAELASRSSLSGQYEATNSPRMYGRQISSSRSGEFWAPNPCASLGASGERVTLEAPNRRISMNADLLLDFQGSPVVMPSPSVTPRLGPSLGATRLHLSPPHKSWDPGHLPASMAASASQSGDGKAGHVKPSAPAALPKDEGVPPAGPANLRPSSSIEQKTRVQLPGPVIQQVTAGIDSTFASVAATVIQPKESWMPRPTLSQRLGLWQSTTLAAPPPWPLPPSAGHGVAGAGQVAGPTASVVARPPVTSRDVQTTPGLAKTVQDIPTQAQGQDAGAVAKPVFRSRIPVPASLVQPQVSEKSVISVATSRSSNPPISEADEESAVAGPTERVVRGHRLRPPAGTSGGAQRIPVMKPAQHVEVAGSEVPPAVGEEEMRRRAHVLGMRISPYLRPKAARVRVSEAQKATKG